MPVMPKDVLDVVDDINKNVLTERTREMRVVVIAAIAGVNCNLLGPPGTGKSLLARAFTERIEGARLFSKTIHAQMPADAIIGGYDMPEFAKSGEFRRNVEHYAPNAHVIFLDEVTRANGPTLDAILPILNTEERLAEGNGGMFQTPCMFVITASNYMPDPDDAHLGAFVDRITLMQYVNPVSADDSFKSMVTNHHARRTAERSKTVKKVTITLEQFSEVQDQVWAVRPTDEFLNAFAELRRQTRLEGLAVSDRRWIELGRVARASAWLAGRDELAPSDLAVLEDGLWRDQEDRSTAHKLVLPFQGRFVQEAAARRAEAEPYLAKLNELRPAAEAVPIGEETPPDVMTPIQAATRALKDVSRRVEQLIDEAAQEKANVPDLRELRAEIQAAKTWLIDNSLTVWK